MNQTTRFVMDIYQVSVIIRDTLEYLIQRKDGYRADIYKQRRTIIETALSEKHALSRFLTENKENGEKIRNNIKDFYDLVYGDEARAVFLENDKVIVDSGYATQLLDYIVGLHETFFDICNGFVKFAKDNNSYEEELSVLLAKENAFRKFMKMSGRSRLLMHTIAVLQVWLLLIKFIDYLLNLINQCMKAKDNKLHKVISLLMI